MLVFTFCKGKCLINFFVESNLTHLDFLKMKYLYQYRDKVNGQWISAPVDGKKIHELVTRGNLTSNDFVREDKQMIRDAFPKSEEHWGMLRKIRIQLNRLWEAQLDDIMAIISSGHHPRIQFREAENSLNKFRDSFSLKKIKDEIRRVWDNETQSSFVQNEIKHRKLSNDPVEFVDLGRDEEEEEILSLSNFEKKISKFEAKVGVQKCLEKRGVYVFWSGDKVTYVGKAETTFGKRFKQHYREQRQLCSDDKGGSKKRFLHDATKVELYLLRMNVGTNPITEFESLMIFHHGDSGNDFRPRDNLKSGSASNPLGAAMKIIEIEVGELRSTG